MFALNDKTTTHCPECGEERFSEDSLGRLRSRKYFSYISVGDSLQQLFNRSNIAQMLQSTGKTVKLVVDDIQLSQVWQEWMTDGRERNTETVRLSCDLTPMV